MECAGRDDYSNTKVFSWQSVRTHLQSTNIVRATRKIKHIRLDVIFFVRGKRFLLGEQSVEVVYGIRSNTRHHFAFVERIRQETGWVCELMCVYCVVCQVICVLAEVSSFAIQILSAIK